MCWGFECRDGWEPILRKACSKLEPLIQARFKQHPKDSWPCASQIKEKYGTLRFYLSTGTDEMFAITDEAERLSERTCEECGAEGKLRGRGWYYTACDKHTKEGDLNATKEG